MDQPPTSNLAEIHALTALFKTTQKGFLPELMQKMYDDRVKFKQLMLEAKKDYERTKDPKLKKLV